MSFFNSDKEHLLFLEEQIAFVERLIQKPEATQ